MKLGINIHHVSGQCRKGFQGQKSMSNYVIVQSKLKRMTENATSGCKMDYEFQTQ